MRIFSVLFVVLSAALVQQLYRAASSTAAGRFEADVLRTLAFALGGGLAVNVGCALVARQLEEAVLPGTEMWSCAPYGTIGGALVARHPAAHRVLKLLERRHHGKRHATGSPRSARAP